MATYTAWDAATGEILRTGDSLEPLAAEGETIWLGEALSADLYRFNIVTGEPYAFARQSTQDELEIAVNRERMRRIQAGKVFDGIYVTGRDEDVRNLTNLALAAQLRLAAGDAVTVTAFRDGDNIDHELTPPQVLSLWQLSAAYVSALYAASWTLKAMDPIPADVTVDQWWP